MQKFLPFFACLLLFQPIAKHSSAQIYNPMFQADISLPDGEDVQNTIGITWNNFAGSNSLNAAFLRKMVFGGEIDNSIKNPIVNKLKESNRLGVWNDLDIFYQRRLSNESSARIGGAYSNSLFLGSQFAGDLWKVVFMGNKAFAGQTAEMGNTTFGLINFHRLQLNYGDVVENGSNHFSFMLGLNFYLGNNAWEMDLGNLSLFTQANGEYLDLNFQSQEILRSDSTSQGLGDIRGLGGGADLNLSLSSSDKTWALFLDLRDIGIIKWKDEGTTNLAFDLENYRFEGIDISRFFGSVNTAAQNEFDSLVDILQPEVESRSGFTTITPVKANLAYQMRLSETISASLGLHTILHNSTKFSPAVYAKGHFKLSQNEGALVLSPSLYLGGLGAYGLGVELEKPWKNNFAFVFGTNGLLGLVVPKTFNTTSLYLGAQVGF